MTSERPDENRADGAMAAWPGAALDLAAKTAPSTARGRRTRAALLDASRRVFERHGFVNAKISDIATEAGVAQGSFYNYFDSKEVSLPS